MNTEMAVELIDLAPKAGNLLKEVLAGLSREQKTIDPKFLYDRRGSELFEEICDLPEYYPTRTERGILEAFGGDIAARLGARCLLVEPGSGSSTKVRHLLPHLDLVGYVPIEISHEMLLGAARGLCAAYPALPVYPVCADFTQELRLPELPTAGARKIVFFPGSTIGNFHPPDAVRFLGHFGKIAGTCGGLLIGVDRKKERERVLRAYDDAAGVTAAFNLNLLLRLNREAGADFELRNFSHLAIYNETLGRVEMHLRSRVAQTVRVHQSVFRFREGETIHTECSYKYAPEEFAGLAERAGFLLEYRWSDPDDLFGVYLLRKGRTA